MTGRMIRYLVMFHRAMMYRLLVSAHGLHVNRRPACTLRDGLLMAV